MSHDKEAGGGIPQSESLQTSMDHQHQQHSKVERFLKLGYSRSDILRVLESLQHDAQTNDILEELIKRCSARSQGARSVPSSPKLVPRGCSPAPSKSPAGAERDPGGFRPVVIDGSNVAMSHGDKKVFSCKGLQLAVNWFWDKGLRDITVFVPLWRKELPRPETPITDQHILHELENRKILVYTPSRCVNGRRVVCYDDRYIIKLAIEYDGIIVSNDNYRDLQTENPKWKEFIEERLLMYTFANDKFMPPDDPLGRNGPTIDNFLRKRPRTPENKLQHCPYGKKCTYGVKCKFYHPERTNQSQIAVADLLRALGAKNSSPAQFQPELGYTSSTPPPCADDPHLRASPGDPSVYQDAGSHGSLHYRPGSDTDEAFSSLDGSMTRLCILRGSSLERSWSSGVGSCDTSASGSYGQRLTASGPGYYSHQSYDCQAYGHPQVRESARQHQRPDWGSCPALPPYNGEQHAHFAEKQRVRQPPGRQSHSLDPWPLSSRARSPQSDDRKELQNQLSALFPPSLVQRVMNDHPHVSDMIELLNLIQRPRTSHLPF